MLLIDDDPHKHLRISLLLIMKFSHIIYSLESITDYESPVINETDYHPHHNHQPPPFARNGYNFGHRPLSRANKINRLYHTDFGIEVRHRGDPASGGTGSYFGYDNEQAEQQIPQQSSDYSDDNRETSVNLNFYDNKYYDNLKLHR